MKLKEIYSSQNNKKPVISYEVFPPKDDTDGSKQEQLFVELHKLMDFSPSLISVTYGAGGSNQTESIEIIRRIKEELKVSPMPHFTCVSTSTKNIKEYLNTLQKFEIENILALRGDIPEDKTICHDFHYASELIEYIKKESTLSIAAAGYPEGHKEAVSLEKDIEYLKQKTEKGAEIIYTQLFFNNKHYFSFIEKCEKAGIDIPIIPGILPITNYKTVEKMATLCKVEIPQTLKDVIEQHKEDKDYIKEFGISYATEQCQQLIDNGVRGLHFYTLNKAHATSEILCNLI